MKLVLLSLLLFLAVISNSQQTINASITHGGLQRDYILYVPDSYSPGTPAPLVFNFHGYTSNALQQMFYGDFRPIADTAGFLVVHPQGTIDLLGNPHWNVGWGNSTLDDLGFTSALMDSLSDQYNIDQTRIYSTGMSNGGFMSYYLACELSDRIAAIASVTGSMSINQTSTCDAQHPMPVMEIHGTADPTVPYEGNILAEDIPSVVNYWVGFNDCDTPADITSIPDTDPTEGCTAEHQRFSGGSNGAEVEHYKIIGGQHTWPGTAFGGLGTNQDIDASKEIWRFFSKYDIHGLIQISAIDDPFNSAPVTVYPNPASSNITIRNEYLQSMHYSLSTMMGKEIISGKTNSNVFEITIDNIPSGMYVLTFGGESFKIIKP